MSSRTYNRWIFTKSCDNSPDGNLRLGQILAKPKDPAYVLQPRGPLSLEDDHIKPEITSRSNVSIHDANELSAQFSAWANLGYVPVHFKASSSSNHMHDVEWHFDRLESQIMSPTLAYVQKAMRHGDVEASLQHWKFKRHVYMVTGVRIVSGARMRRKDKTLVDNTLMAQGAAPDQSVSAGTRAKLAASSSESEEFDKATDFVFAYRLSEVSYRGTIKHKPYTKGEVASADKRVVQNEFEVEVTGFEVLELVEFDLSDEEDDFERVPVSGYDELESFVSKFDEKNAE
jgi:hypothetical protein